MKKRNSSVNKTIHNFYLSKLKNPKIKKLYSRFKRIISKDTDKNYCVAISGGPDSMALAFLTKCLSIERGTSNVYFHIDHKLRKESKKVKVLSCAELFAQVMHNVHHNKSIAKKFIM